MRGGGWKAGLLALAAACGGATTAANRAPLAPLMPEPSARTISKGLGPARSHFAATVASRAIGPFLERSPTGGLLAWIAPNGKTTAHDLDVVPLGVDGAPFGAPRTVTTVPEETTSLVLPASGSTHPGWLAAWDRRPRPGSEGLSIVGVAPDGSTKAGPFDVERTTDHIQWVDVVPTPRRRPLRLGWSRLPAARRTSSRRLSTRTASREGSPFASRGASSAGPPCATGTAWRWRSWGPGGRRREGRGRALVVATRRRRPPAREPGPDRREADRHRRRRRGPGGARVGARLERRHGRGRPGDARRGRRRGARHRSPSRDGGGRRLEPRRARVRARRRRPRVDGAAGERAAGANACTWRACRPRAPVGHAAHVVRPRRDQRRPASSLAPRPASGCSPRPGSAAPTTARSAATRSRRRSSASMGA